MGIRLEVRVRGAVFGDETSGAGKGSLSSTLIQEFVKAILRRLSIKIDQQPNSIDKGAGEDDGNKGLHD